MQGTYANAPLLEAICELRFVPGAPWDWTIPGVLYERVKGEFPSKRTRGSVQVGVEITPAAGPGAVSAVGGVTGMRFDSSDGGRILQVDPDLLIMNQVRPYAGWQDFRRQIADGLRHYRDVAAPTAILHAELRYINQFPLESELPLRDRFNLYPHLPVEDAQLRNMLLMAELIRENPVGAFRVTFARALIGDSGEGLVLDFQYGTADGVTMPCDDLFVWLDAAHSAIEEMFDSAVTAVTKESFGEVIHATSAASL